VADGRWRGTFHNVWFLFYEAGKKIGAHITRFLIVPLLISFVFLSGKYQKELVDINPSARFADAMK
jgi:hypothetical protein